MEKKKKSSWSFVWGNDKYVYLALILINVLSRVPFLHTFDLVAYDGTYYLNEARTIFSSTMSGSFPIGYPIVVRLFHLVLRDYQLAGMAVSFVAGIGSAIVAWRLARHFVRRELAFLAAVAVALNPLVIRLSLMTLSESLYTFLVLLGLLMFVEKRWLSFGLAMGMAAITRPEAIAVVGLLGLTRIRHPKQAAAIAVAFLAIYAVNNARLSVAMGRIVILPKSKFIGSSTQYWKLREAAIDYEGRDETDGLIASEEEQRSELVDYGKRLPQELANVVRYVFPVVLLLSLYALRRRKYVFMAAALVPFFVIPLATVRSIDRYLLPYLPVLILLAVFAAGDMRNRVARSIAVGLLGASILILPVYNRAALLVPEEMGFEQVKRAGLEFRGDVKPDDKIADRKPFFAFYSGGEYVEIPVAPYDDAMKDLTTIEKVKYLVLHQWTIHKLRPAFRPLMYSKAVMNGELRFRQIYFDPQGLMIFQRVLDKDPLHWNRITPTEGTYISPAWSPDGRQLAFRSKTGEREGSICVMDIPGDGRVREITSAVPLNDGLSWSPDGKRIAYADGEPGAADLFVVDVEGGGVEPIVTGTADDLSPSWSPSGAEILFSSDRTGQSEVWAIELATGRLNQITADGGNTHPCVSPSGDKVAWIKNDLGVEVYDGSTGDLTRLLAPRKVRYAPTWSPDERYLAVTASDWGSPDVYLMKVDGTSALLLTKRWKRDGMPVWSPDGQRMAVASDGEGEDFGIWVLEGLRPYTMQLETAKPLRVFTGVVVD
jgi:hypothetical protein